MKTTIVRKSRIGKPSGMMVKTKWAKQLEMAKRLKPNQAVKIEFSNRTKKLSEKAREGISAVIYRHYKNLKVSKQGNTIYIMKKR